MATQQPLTYDVAEIQVEQSEDRLDTMGVVIMLFTLGVLGYLVTLFLGAAFRPF